MDEPKRLKASVGEAALRFLGPHAFRRNLHPIAARCLSVVLVGIIACGLLGTALLAHDFSEASFSVYTAAGWGTAAAFLVWSTWALKERSWIGALLGLVALAVGLWIARGELSAELQLAWECATTWTLPTGSFDLLVNAGFALLGIVVGLSVFSWHCGWLLSLGALVILALCPREAIEPGLLGVGLMVVYSAAILAHGFVDRLFAWRTSLAVAAALVSLVSVALAVVLATTIPQLLRAPAEAIDTAADHISSLLPGASERTAQRIASNVSGALGSSGVVNRGDLDIPATQPLVHLTASQPLDTTLYLAHFRGGTYTDGRWEAVVAPVGLLTQTRASILGVSSEAETLDAASFFAAGSLVLSGSDPTVLSMAMATAGLDAVDLQPYAAHSLTTSDAASLMYGIVPMGTYSDLCGIGVLDPGLPLGWTSAATAFPNAVVEQAQQVLSDYLPQAYASYRAVPTEEMPRLCQLVAENPQATVGEAVAFVRETLAANATYTTTPGTFPADVSIPEYLLFEGHQGYCQQFATTATLMLRLYGIPARYVTGLAAPASVWQQTAEGTWETTLDLSRAHAWVEIYTGLLGWVPIEITPSSAQDAAPYRNDTAGDETPPTNDETPPAPEEEPEAPEPEEDEATSPETTPDPADPSPEEETPPAPADAERPGTWPWLPILAGALAVAATIAACVEILRRHRRRILDRRASASAEGVLAELVEVLHFGGRMDDWNGSEDGFAEELSRTVPAVKLPQARLVVEEALSAAFGSPAGAPEASSETREVYDQVCTSIYDELGTARRLVFTWIRAFR